MSSTRTELKLCKGPACPHFKCGRNFLRIVKRGYNVSVICTLTNDQCIGYKCQYAICTAHAMDPNGRCLLDLRKDEKEEELSIIEEAKKIDKELAKIKHHLKRFKLEDYI